MADLRRHDAVWGRKIRGLAGDCKPRRRPEAAPETEIVRGFGRFRSAKRVRLRRSAPATRYARRRRRFDIATSIAYDRTQRNRRDRRVEKARAEKFSRRESDFHPRIVCESVCRRFAIFAFSAPTEPEFSAPAEKICIAPNESKFGRRRARDPFGGTNGRKRNATGRTARRNSPMRRSRRRDRVVATNGAPERRRASIRARRRRMRADRRKNRSAARARIDDIARAFENTLAIKGLSGIARHRRIQTTATLAFREIGMTRRQWDSGRHLFAADSDFCRRPPTMRTISRHRRRIPRETILSNEKFPYRVYNDSRDSRPLRCPRGVGPVKKKMHAKEMLERFHKNILILCVFAVLADSFDRDRGNGGAYVFFPATGHANEAASIVVRRESAIRGKDRRHDIGGEGATAAKKSSKKSQPHPGG